MSTDSEDTGAAVSGAAVAGTAVAGRDADDELVRPGRDAEATKRALIRAARRRFATDGYRATTVRHIAADAGVNVALINRYFVSKDGLFEACMRRTSDELESETPGGPADLDAIVQRLIGHVLRAPNNDDPLQLLLLLRSSGDANADRIRRETLEEFTRRLAVAAGWRPDDPRTAPVLVRAQLAIATMMGVTVMRTSAAVEPIASAADEDLREPLDRMFRVLLGAESATTEPC
ncbi:TetR/AcrR family transcriptional regulator [Rathayibacter sp. VKM Ac-2857]|uniref:TetR/AcrR family transcriptional regulator n=1 Tax=Rathayibacter sp. VKM Ac-2857 TaxID=2739020 RepID=UPI0015631FAC|nr:TetR/AcrR family transcriptional regulator [Rathayibacter sp. VKM Ac-2857]NQX15672.1 helix-turn-helix transcriptional regulator [Rathayibacter sp. VKM Ac-2857]